MVQGPVLQCLLERARAASSSLRSVLNAGAGEGLFSHLLLAIPGVEQVIEVDISYRSHTRAPTDSRQHLIGASLTAIPLANEAVDLVLCSEVLEHIVDDDRTLSELGRVLSLGGWILISVPTPPAIFDPAHVREGYSPTELSAMLAARGMEAVELRFCMYAPFRLLLRMSRRYGRMPRGVIWGVSLLDRACPYGPPMNLIVLARAASRGNLAGLSATESLNGLRDSAL